MRIRKTKIWVLFCFCFISSIVLHTDIVFAAIFNVPSVQYPTIQAGINAAGNGDTVLVADGTYTGEGNYNITFQGKAINLQSQNGPLDCVIDAQEEGRGILFQNNEGPDSVLNGFTIINAKNGYINANDNGAGIYCDNASPTISTCIIKNCSSVGFAGGLYFRYSSASLTDCIISDNTAAEYGGGIFCDTSPITISNCTVTRNSAIYFGGGNYSRESSLTIKNCIFSENTGFVGGGLFLSQSDAMITNCRITNNHSTGDGGGGGLYVTYCSPEIKNCTINGNSASDHGGGIVYNNCYAPPTLTNSILWGNTPDEIFIEEFDLSNPTVKFCDIKGGYNGEGNFHGDPLFIDPLAGDFHLSVRSPCVDTGMLEGAPDVDIEGNIRPQGIGVDVGAYELSGYANTRPHINTFTIAPHSVSVPMEVSFTCIAEDPDGEITSYTIEYGDGSAPETNSTGYFEHTYDSVDAYATCSAMDNSGLMVNSESLSPLFNGIIEVPGDYANIQAAMDAAADKVNTTVLVADGIYMGEGNRNLDFKGKAIRVKSQNGPTNTIIHCERDGRGFLFQNKEGPDSILSGFTITYGALPLSAPYGGGIYCSSSPTIENCIIRNSEDSGIYINRGSPSITDCIITENKTNYYGGGIFILEGTPTISACTITNNIAFGPGAGSGTGGGGGIYCHANGANPTIINSVISKNAANNSGGGIYGSSAGYTAINCTFSENVSFGGAGGAVYHYSSSETFPTPTFTNCIFWGNQPNEIYSGSSGYSNPSVSYSNIQEGYPGEGNISQDPVFIDPQGDNFKLNQSSPSIDTGTSNSAPVIDRVGVSRPQISGFDMGAFETSAYDPMQPVIDSFTANTTEGTAPLEVFFTCLANDTDGVIVNYTIDYGDGSDPDTNTSGDFTHIYESVGQSLATCSVIDNDGKSAQSKKIAIRRQGTIHVPASYATMQAAVDAASDGDTVLVGDGIYTGHMNKNILFWGKAITVQSENGPEYTVVDCEQDGRGFSFSHFEDTDSVISGFKIINGYVDNGGGGVLCFQSSPTITNCIIQGNTHTSTSSGGGGISCSEYASPIVSNTIISGNTSARYGGGIYCHTYGYPTIINSKIVNNTAEWAGGGIYNFWNSFASIISSEITGNNVISGAGGGIYSRVSYLTVLNSIISKNNASYRGGGIHLETSQKPGMDEYGNNAIISNCTISQNSASEGAGIYYSLYSPAPTTNSIIWNNTPDEIKYESMEPSVTFSNISGGYPGSGNIDVDPLFLDPENGEYHLTVNSPCIDTGTPDFAPLFDINGEQRPIGLGYDMGADEYYDSDNDELPNYREIIFGTNPNLPDTDTDNMPDGWEVDNGLNPLVDDAGDDADGDGANNLLEYRRGTDPNDSNSVPKMAMPWIPFLLLNE